MTLEVTSCSKCIQVCVLCYVCLIGFLLIDIGEANDGKLVEHRQKRYLSFRNMSHFFLRFNFKANMVPWNQIFAQALGFRMNWNNPPDTFHPYRSHYIYRRTIYSHMETLLDKNGLNGFECVRRAICELEALPAEPRKIYHKLLKMVFRQKSSVTDKWHNKTTEDCEISVASCPFSFLSVSLYTDI